MKKRMIVGGSVGVVVLLVLTLFSAVVGAQATKATITELVSEVQNKEIINEKMPLLQQIKAFTGNTEWFPGYLILYIISILGMIGSQIIIWLLSGYY